VADKSDQDPNPHDTHCFGSLVPAPVRISIEAKSWIRIQIQIRIEINADPQHCSKKLGRRYLELPKRASCLVCKLSVP
jgi:hypothetical protein